MQLFVIVIVSSRRLHISVQPALLSVILDRSCRFPAILQCVRSISTFWLNTALTCVSTTFLLNVRSLHLAHISEASSILSIANEISCARSPAVLRMCLISRVGACVYLCTFFEKAISFQFPSLVISAIRVETVEL